MRDTERQRHRQREREKQAPCREPDAELDPRIQGSCPEPKADAHPLSHPDAPKKRISSRLPAECRAQQHTHSLGTPGWLCS